MSQPETRFCYTTDPEIGVPGYYRHNDDGTIDPTVRYKWVDDSPDNPSDELGHFEPHDKQYALVEQPASVVPLEATAHMAADATVQPEPPTQGKSLMERLLGR